MSFEYITIDPEILGGKPCIRGTRISVDLILEWLASGATSHDIVQRYPRISESAIAEALRYAATILKNEMVFDLPISR